MRLFRRTLGLLAGLAHPGRGRLHGGDNGDPSATALPTWMRPDCRRPLGTPPGVWRASVGHLEVDVDVDDNTVCVSFDDVPLALLLLPAMGSTSAGARLWLDGDADNGPVQAHEFLVGAVKNGEVFTRLHHGPLPALLYEEGALKLRFYRVSPTEGVPPSAGYTVGYQLDDDPADGVGGAYNHMYRLFRAPDGRWDVWDVDPPERGGTAARRTSSSLRPARRPTPRQSHHSDRVRDQALLQGASLAPLTDCRFPFPADHRRPRAGRRRLVRRP